MKKKVKLGVVGFGRIVELIHLPLVKKVPEIEVEGIFDITPQRLELAARRGFPTYRCWDRFYLSTGAHSPIRLGGIIRREIIPFGVAQRSQIGRRSIIGLGRSSYRSIPEY
jgi:hypothetical protein